MNATVLMCAVRTRCVQTVRRPPLLLPPVSVSASFTIQRCLQSTQPVPAARLPYRVKLSAGKRYAWCACGHSKKQQTKNSPYCDGSHLKVIYRDVIKYVKGLFK
ncbi:hypothetical protein CCH79_00014029 [Gambusia affinis]|uniref:Iron-binding zinc finger CDGSH type domain-containing protein n=1 Tax=Gambusia affinis TaxID=33528 RepID=A0A315W254_GAMAF|nr:hypothetical protein CCH79_00014029 [Gambusia affinis]